MHEDILAGGALDESVSLRPVEPLHSTLLSHKETPFASSLRIILPPLVCCPACLPWEIGRTLQGNPLERTQEFFHWRRRAPTKPPQHKRLPLYFVARLPATKYCGAAKTKARCRTANTETSILMLANRVRLTK